MKPQTLLLLLLAVCLPAALRADDPPRLPTASELKRLIESCEKELASGKPVARAKPPEAAPSEKQPGQRPPTARDREAATRIAAELAAEKRLDDKEMAFYLKRLKRLRVQETLAVLYPLLTFQSPEGARWVTLELGQALLPKIFRKELARQRPGGRKRGPKQGKEQEEDHTRVDCHSQQHLAIRGWMIQEARGSRELRDIIAKRIEKARKLVDELGRARNEDDVERVTVALARTGEEWVVYPLTHKLRIVHPPTRKAVQRLLEHFMGFEGQPPGRKRKRSDWWEKQAATAARRFVFRERCAYCRWVIGKLYVRSGD